jgi:prepilin-type N-terminal cleavage/methylation domain-containing protein
MNRRGFTVIEVLLAMSLLVIGMTGIMSIFTVALALQKEATERWDAGINLLQVQAEVERDLGARLGGSTKAGPADLSGKDYPVPGEPGLRYRVTLEAMADDPTGRGFWGRIEIIARAKGQERSYDLGYVPLIPERTNDALIRGMLNR